MEMEKPVKVTVKNAKTLVNNAKSLQTTKLIKTINYVYLNNGMIIAEK